MTNPFGGVDVSIRAAVLEFVEVLVYGVDFLIQRLKKRRGKEEKRREKN